MDAYLHEVTVVDANRDEDDASIPLEDISVLVGIRHPGALGRVYDAHCSLAMSPQHRIAKAQAGE